MRLLKAIIVDTAVHRRSLGPDGFGETFVASLCIRYPRLSVNRSHRMYSLIPGYYRLVVISPTVMAMMSLKWL